MVLQQQVSNVNTVTRFISAFYLFGTNLFLVVTVVSVFKQTTQRMMNEATGQATAICIHLQIVQALPAVSYNVKHAL